MASLQLSTEVQYVKGIGPRTAVVLAEMWETGQEPAAIDHALEH